MARGYLHEHRMRGESLSPGLLRNPTSPRTRGEVTRLAEPQSQPKAILPYRRASRK